MDDEEPPPRVQIARAVRAGGTTEIRTRMPVRACGLEPHVSTDSTIVPGTPGSALKRNPGGARSNQERSSRERRPLSAFAAFILSCAAPCDKMEWDRMFGFGYRGVVDEAYCSAFQSPAIQPPSKARALFLVDKSVDERPRNLVGYCVFRSPRAPRSYAIGRWADGPITRGCAGRCSIHALCAFRSFYAFMFLKLRVTGDG